MSEHEESNNFGNDNKKKIQKIIGFGVLLVLFLVPIGFGIYALIPEPTPPAPPPTPVITYEVKLLNNDGGQLTLSNTVAYSSKSFSSDITLNRSIAPTKIMPDSLSASDVLCLDQEIKFTYKVSEDKYSAHIDIPSSEIKGNITINVPLIVPAETFPITLESNAGEFPDGSHTITVQAYSGARLIDLEGYQKPTNFREGYDFAYWAKDDYSQILYENEPIPYYPDGATFIANGERNEIEVEINPDGGTFKGKNPGEHLKLNTLYDTVINEIDDYVGEPTKEGYTFLYYVDVNLKHYLPTDTVTVPELTLGLKAVYSNNLKITLNPGEGTFSDSSPTKTFDSYSGITLSMLEGYEEPTKSGADFTYWTIVSDPEFYYKNTELNFTGEITLTAHFENCEHDTFSEYTVIDNQLYGICEHCKAQILISDEQLVSGTYDNKFLLYDKGTDSYGTLRDVSTEMESIVLAAEDHATLDMYFIHGLYELEADRATGQTTITLNAHGLVDNSGNQIAKVDCSDYSKTPESREPRFFRYVNLVFDNMIMQSDVVLYDFYLGLSAASITYNHCYFTGTQSIYSPNVIFNDCIFDSRRAEDGAEYSLYGYASTNVEFNRCDFHSDGKTIKVYSEGAGAGATYKFSDCRFYNETRKRLDKAAIEVDSIKQSKHPYKIYISRCAYTEGDFASLYHDDSINARFIVTD